MKSPSGRWNSAPMITTSNPHVDDLDVKTVLAVKALLDADPEHRRILAAGAVGDAKVGESLRRGWMCEKENKKCRNGQLKRVVGPISSKVANCYHSDLLDCRHFHGDPEPKS